MLIRRWAIRATNCVKVSSNFARFNAQESPPLSTRARQFAYDKIAIAPNSFSPKEDLL